VKKDVKVAKSVSKKVHCMVLTEVTEGSVPEAIGFPKEGAP